MNRKSLIAAVIVACSSALVGSWAHAHRWRVLHKATLKVSNRPRIVLAGLPLEVELLPGADGEVTLELSGRRLKRLPYTVIQIGDDTVEVTGTAVLDRRPELDPSFRLVVFVPARLELLSADCCASLVLPNTPANMLVS
jgi:hypothetical protein